MQRLILILSILITLPGCFPFMLIALYEQDQVYVEEDQVKSSKRIHRQFNYYRALERNSPLTTVKQTILKVINESNTNYFVYDRVTLRSGSYNISNDVYIIVDNQVFPLNITKNEFEHKRNIDEDTKNILAADSTHITVVTGYTEYNYNIYKLEYTLSPEIIEKLKDANEVNFRYYSGPHMITTRLSNYYLDRLKELLFMI